MNARAAVAVDGGQTGMRAVAVTDEGPGRVVHGRGFARHGGRDPLTTTLEDVVGLVTRLDVSAGVLLLGLTSAPADPPDRRRLAARVRDALGAWQVWVTIDMVTGHAGALGGGDGVVVCAGTGAVTLAAHGDRIERADGHGYLLGDEGSGFALGRAGLVAALRGAERRGPATGLSAAMRRYWDDLGLRTVHDVYDTEHPVGAIAGFAPAVTAAAADGDVVATALVESAADDLATTVAGAIDRCFPPGPDSVPVSYCGGLFAAGATILDPFNAALTRRCGRAALRAPLGDSLAGAVHLLTHGVDRYGQLVTAATEGSAR